MAATGAHPANLHRSTDASVCPLLTSTPPSRALSGKICPGLENVTEVEFGDASKRTVRARSWADIPVVISIQSYQHLFGVSFIINKINNNNNKIIIK